MFKEFRIIDLTLELSEELPCYWPTHIPFQKKKYNWYETVRTVNGIELSDKLAPYFSQWIIIDDHTGTHFDAPSHFIPHPDTGYAHAGPAGAITGEKVNLEDLTGPAVVIDLRELTGKGSNGESPFITPAHIKQWEEKNGPIEKGDVVLFYTGWDKYYLPGEAGKAFAFNPLIAQTGPGWPSPNPETAEYLNERGVVCMGTDGTSIGAAHEGIPVHLAGLSKGMLNVESLCNLHQLPTRGAYFMFLPIKVAGSSGGPGRAIGLVRK